MKRTFLPKNYLSFILIVIMLFGRNFSFAQTGQTNCGWQQGDMITYSQTDWGFGQSAAGTLLFTHFAFLYGSNLSIGDFYHLYFRTGDDVTLYLPETLSAGVLTGSIVSPSSSPAGEFGGEVLALKLNVDFSDAHFLSSVFPLGDLIFHDVDGLPILNGQSVREVLATLNTFLGGGSAPFNVSVATGIARAVNEAFANGTPSQFAQDHLKRGWDQGEMTTYTQTDWGNSTSQAGILLNQHFSNFFRSYPYLMIGGIYSLYLSNAGAVFSWLPDANTGGVFSNNYLDPFTTPAGEFAGEVTALVLNITFSDSNVYGDIVPLGDLVFYNTSISALNGMSIREFTAIANQIIGGDYINSLFTLSQAISITRVINNAFHNGTPTQFAQENLFFPCKTECPTTTLWQVGDYRTRTQDQWDATVDWYLAYDQIFTSTFGIIEIGIPGAAGYSMRFSDASRVSDYLTQSGTPAALTKDLNDPTSSATGQFSAEVLTLKMNVVWSDEGETPSVGGIAYGDLILQNLTNSPQLNGLTVREVLAIADIVLGGGTSIISVTEVNEVVEDLNFAFCLADRVSTFGLNNLVLPCTTTPANHCPTATTSTVATSVGKVINIQLQAADEDNDVLTYSISQNPLHGTVSVSTTGLATYTPTAGYSGTDQFKFKASDGTCDAEAAVDISIVVCPKGKGEWKNKPGIWPVSSLKLGSQTYTKTELLNILNMPVGSGQKADASLILATQLIAAKLSIANNTVGGSIVATIAHADALFSAFSGKLPYGVKPNTPAGKAMTTDASALENFNGGSQTIGCTASQSAARLATTMEIVPVDFILEQNQPNPFYNTSIIRYHLPVEAANYRVTLKLYDVLGREIKTLVDEKQGAGVKTISFNASLLSGGVYYYRLTAGKFAAVKKMILVK